jgi:hypothetical protein
MTSPVPDQLLQDLAALAADHPIDAGLLGEYALTGRQHGPEVATETYPSVAAHLRAGCEHCQDNLDALDGLAPRAGPSRSTPPSARADSTPPSEPPAETPAPAAPPATPEPIEIADAVALARVIEAEREALRTPLRPDRAGQIDTRRQGARRRHLLLVEAALIRQRLSARSLFLDRALAARAPGRPLNPKAGLLLDDLAGQVDDLGRLSGRISRLTADLRRLGDDPRGPARSQADVLTERGLTKTRDALALDRRLSRLQGPLAGMV